MMHRLPSTSQPRYEHRLTLRRFAGLVLTGVVVGVVIGLNEPLIAGDVTPSPVIRALDGWHPTARELCGLFLLGTVTIAGTRMRRLTRAEHDRAVLARPARLVRGGTRPIRVLELRSVRGTGGGPEKTILLGARREPACAVEVTVCYIRDSRDPAFAMDRRASDAQIDYLEIVERHSFDPKVWTDLTRVIRERRIDIVHSHEYKTNLLALMAGRLGLATPLSTAHGWNPTTLRETAFYYPADKRLLAAFPHVIAVSSVIRDELIAHGARPEHVSVVLNGIDAQVFSRRPAAEAAARARLGLTADQFVIGTIGRLAPEKDFGSLIHAFAALHARFQSLALLVVGDGPERPALERLAADLELGRDCRFLGRQSNIIEIHHALDLFVQSSRTEGTPNVVLEAMAMETPIVATAAGGTCELVRDGVHALIVPPDDRAALARAMKTAIGDRAAARSRALLARARVEADLSFVGRRRAVEAIYKRLISDRAHQPIGVTELAPSA